MLSMNRFCTIRFPQCSRNDCIIKDNLPLLRKKTKDGRTIQYPKSIIVHKVQKIDAPGVKTREYIMHLGGLRDWILSLKYYA